MRAKRTWLIGVGAAVALLAAGCGGSTNAGASSSGGAEIVPSSAAAYVSVDSDLSSGQWKAVDGLLSKFPDRDKLLTQLRQSFEKEVKVSWENDVKPALGSEIDVAVLNLEQGADAVGLTQPKDTGAFDDLVKKINAQAKTPSDKVYVIDYKDWKVFSDSQAKLDTFKQEADAGSALADDATFKEAMGKLADEALVKAYANGAKVTTAVMKAFSQLAPGQQQNRTKLVWAAAQALAENDGIRVDAHFKTEGAKIKAPTYKAKLLDEVPSGALLYLSFNGQSLGNQALRTQLEQGVNGGAGAAVPGVKQLLPLLERLGALFRHENALYVRTGSPIPEITILAEPDSPQQGIAAIDKLVARLAAMAGAPIKPRPIAIGTVHAKEINLGRFSIYYGAEGDKLVITDQQQAFQDLLGSGAKLSADPTFKEAVSASGMPGETNGFFYVNLKDSIPLVESLAQLGGSTVPPDVSANLRPLRTFVLWVGSGENLTSLSLFLEVK